MPNHVSTIKKVPEAQLQSLIDDFKNIDEADIVTAYRDGEGTYSVDATIFVADDPAAGAATAIVKTGKMSVFGGPDDTFMRPDEGLALYNEDQLATAPPGLGRRLNPQAMYLACRWDFGVTPKEYLRTIKVKVSSNGQSRDAFPADDGPNEDTGRVADLSPGLAAALNLRTDDICTVTIPPPQTGVAVAQDLRAVDQMVFPSKVTRALIALTTMNNGIYWIDDQIDSVGGGQTMMRRIGNGPPEVVLSKTTLFPIAESDMIPALVANELNKAILPEAPLPKDPTKPAPQAGDDINAKVFAEAQAFVGHSTSNVPGTDNGVLACAWAVNEVVRRALGKPIQVDSHGDNGLGTDGIFDQLQKHHTATTTPTPGSIVISPTPPRGTVHGHVGIVGQNPGGVVGNTQIFSNSSSAKKFAQNRTIQSWTSFYSGELGLQVLFFNLNADQFTAVQG